MGRLTEEDNNGNWRLKGLPWEAVRSGAVLTKWAWEKIYIALCKLLEYEETGLDPDEIERMKDGYLPPEKWEAIDLAYTEICRELEACKKTLKKQGEELSACKKALEEQDRKQGCIPCGKRSMKRLASDNQDADN